jgi:hypothetical protein
VQQNLHRYYISRVEGSLHSGLHAKFAAQQIDVNHVGAVGQGEVYCSRPICADPTA